jgi:hypothetical protein
MIIVGYAIKRIYSFNVKCDDVDCTRAKSAIERASRIEEKVKKIELVLIEVRTEAKDSHKHLKGELDRLDRYIDDIQRSTFELHGLLIGSGSYSPSKKKRRIIHDDD